MVAIIGAECPANSIEFDQVCSRETRIREDEIVIGVTPTSETLLHAFKVPEELEFSEIFAPSRSSREPPCFAQQRPDRTSDRY